MLIIGRVQLTNIHTYTVALASHLGVATATEDRTETTQSLSEMAYAVTREQEMATLNLYVLYTYIILTTIFKNTQYLSNLLE